MALLTLESVHRDATTKHATLHNHVATMQRELNAMLNNHATQLTNVAAELRLLPVLVERLNLLGEIIQDMQERVAIMLEGLLVASIQSGAVTQDAYDTALEIARADYYAMVTAEQAAPDSNGLDELPVPFGLGNNQTTDSSSGAQAPTAVDDADDENAVTVE